MREQDLTETITRFMTELLPDFIDGYRRLDTDGLTDAVRSELGLGSSSDFELEVARKNVFETIRKWN